MRLFSKKESVSFIDLVHLLLVERAARTAKVPGTDKTVDVPANTVAKFKVGKSSKRSCFGK